MEEFVIWYNTKRPHMSLNWDTVRNTSPSILQKERQKEEPTTLYY